jgi:hypothetical protein
VQLREPRQKACEGFRFQNVAKGGESANHHTANEKPENELK